MGGDEGISFGSCSPGNTRGGVKKSVGRVNRPLLQTRRAVAKGWETMDKEIEERLDEIWSDVIAARDAVSEALQGLAALKQSIREKEIERLEKKVAKNK